MPQPQPPAGHEDPAVGHVPAGDWDPDWEILGSRETWNRVGTHINYPTWWVLNWGNWLLRNVLKDGVITRDVHMEYFSVWQGVPGVLKGPEVQHSFMTHSSLNWRDCPTGDPARPFVRFPPLSRRQMLHIHPVIFLEPAIFFSKLTDARHVKCPLCGCRANADGQNYGNRKVVIDMERELLTTSRQWVCRERYLDGSKCRREGGCGLKFSLAHPGYIAQLPRVVARIYDSLVVRGKQSITRPVQDLITRLGTRLSFARIHGFLEDARHTRYVRSRELHLLATLADATNAGRTADNNPAIKALKDCQKTMTALQGRAQFAKDTVDKARRQKRAARDAQDAAEAAVPQDPYVPLPRKRKEAPDGIDGRDLPVSVREHLARTPGRSPQDSQPPGAICATPPRRPLGGAGAARRARAAR
ncbi:unnamed protein product [Pedinophyceae sp. YPF-701]|nr:unnamed protein product [Pedinophyceae sp. YPF-701]